MLLKQHMIDQPKWFIAVTVNWLNGAKRSIKVMGFYNKKGRVVLFGSKKNAPLNEAFQKSNQRKQNGKFFKTCYRL